MSSYNPSIHIPPTTLITRRLTLWAKSQEQTFRYMQRRMGPLINWRSLLLITSVAKRIKDKRRYFIWIEDKNPNQPRPRDTISAHPIPKPFEYTHRRTKDIASVILNAFAFIHPNNFRNILTQQCIAQTTLYMSLLWYPWRKRRSFRRYLTMDRYPSFLPSWDVWMTLR